RTPTSTPSITPTPTQTNTPTPTTPTSTPTITSTPQPVVVGHVNWEAHQTQPSPYQALPITLTLKLGTRELDYPSQSTDTSGFFTVTVSGLPAGTYDWRAKGPDGAVKTLHSDPAGFLSNSGTVTLTGAPTGQTNLEMGLMS